MSFTQKLQTMNGTAPPFQTCYVCWKLLPEMIVFEPEDLGMFEEGNIAYIR